MPRVSKTLDEFAQALGTPIFLVPLATARGVCPEKCLPSESFCSLFRTITGKKIGACMTELDLECVRIPVLFQQQHFCHLCAGPLRFGSSHSITGCDDRLQIHMLRSTGSKGKMLREAYALCRDENDGGSKAIESALSVLAFWLSSELEELGKRKPSHEPSAVWHAKEIASSHLGGELSTRDVATAVGLSVQHFCRQFKKTTGLTFIEYVTELRICHACTLLTESSLRISEIAFDVGFQSLSRFNVAFRAHTGVSPTEWRSKH